MRLLIWIPFLSLLLFTEEIRADIYKMTDANGVTHYTNVRPSKGRWKKVYKSGKSRDRSKSNKRRNTAFPNDPSRYSRYDSHIKEAAMLYQLPPSFIRAILRVESNFYPDVVSSAGAMGLMQLMPATAAQMGVRNPFNPRESILGGARFLRILANNFNGDLLLTIAAYNAGQGAVEKYKGVPPYAETRRYLHNVLRYYYLYRMEESR